MTSKLTREQLRERAQLKAKNLTYAISQSAFAGVRSELEEELQFLQCALACLEGVNSEPAPAVPKEMTAGIAVKHWEGGRGSIESFVAGYNFCRAAMLQASPVCTCPSGDGSLRWSCPVHAGNSPAIGIDLASGPDPTFEVRYVAPPGYVMVPVEPTNEILDEFDSIIDYGAEDSEDAWRRLLAAAPQEVK